MGNVDRTASNGVYHVPRGYPGISSFLLAETDLGFGRRGDRAYPSVLHADAYQRHESGHDQEVIEGQGFGRVEIVYRFDRPFLLPSLLALVDLSTDMGIVVHKSTGPLPSGQR